jgi:hypothetical protein
MRSIPSITFLCLLAAPAWADEGSTTTWLAKTLGVRLDGPSRPAPRPPARIGREEAAIMTHVALGQRSSDLRTSAIEGGGVYITDKKPVDQSEQVKAAGLGEQAEILHFLMRPEVRGRIREPILIATNPKGPGGGTSTPPREDRENC